MDVTFSRFVSALRHAQVPVSPAETLDGFAIIQQVGVADPYLLQNALSLVFAKTREEKLRFADCFERFFHQLAFQEPPKRSMLKTVDVERLLQDVEHRASEDLQNLIESIVQSDRDYLAYRVQSIAEKIHIQDMHTLREKSSFADAILRDLGLPELEALAGGGGEFGGVLRYLRQYVVQQVRSFVDEQYRLVVDASGKQALIDAALKSHLAQLPPAYYDEVNKVVRKLADRLAQQHRRRAKRDRRGALDIKKLLRDNIAYDGAMFRLSWRSKKRERGTVYVVCDISNSVARVARFLLLLLHSLSEVLPNVRSFAFSSQLGEITDLFARHDHDRAIEEALVLWGQGATDYGRALIDFRKLVKDDLDHRSTIVFLGDARSNYYDPHADVLKGLSQRVKRVYWLNPESRDTWGEGDSEMLRYGAYCLKTATCGHLTDLNRFADSLLSATR